MTPADVRAAVEAIRECRDSRGEIDCEVAHGLEDELHARVLLAIALGATDPIGLANAALETGAIAFDRWYA